MSAPAWRRGGSGARVAASQAMLHAAASTARPAITNSGASCGSAAVPPASRVIGAVSANIAGADEAERKAARLGVHACSIHNAVGAGTPAIAHPGVKLIAVVQASSAIGSCGDIDAV